MKAAAALVALAGLAAAHMELKSPPAFRSSHNPYTGNDVDYNIRSPLAADGRDFPCKGYYKRLVGTPEGRSVATWAPGGSYAMTITGNTPHNGGSCQASLSFDGGASWKVVHSYIGSCPVMGDSSYRFTLPADTPLGDALFAWSWFNWGGNREMYMNCAAVTIATAPGAAARRRRRDASAPISSRPGMFVANVDNGVCTYEGADVEFPEPGPDVTRKSRGTRSPGYGGDCSSWGGDYGRGRK